ncbi:hypothetical protein RQP46_010450 [Phenoliferia psychrophenolica]
MLSVLLLGVASSCLARGAQATTIPLIPRSVGDLALPNSLLSTVQDNSTCPPSLVHAAKTYGGTKHSNGTEVRLRISNGGAGVLGDTTQSIEYIASGEATHAITYNAAAENASINLGIASKRIYGFRDHFYVVGPPGNPANLSSADDALTIFNKLVTGGDAEAGTTRFLSRYDKSATNIKESLLFATIGHTPWALPVSKWYHQYPVFPLQALSAASLLGEYTLTDKGTYLTLQASNHNLTDALAVYKMGNDTDPGDLLLNPASVLLSAKICGRNEALAEEFMEWMARADGGQAVVAAFVQPGAMEVLYSSAPHCTVSPANCVGWSP